MIPRAWIALGAVAALAGWSWWIFGLGVERGAARELAKAEAARAALELELDGAAEELRSAEEKIAAYREAQEILSREIEDEARADPGAVDRVPSPDSLRRLQARWGGGDLAPKP